MTGATLVVAVGQLYDANDRRDPAAIAFWRRELDAVAGLANIAERAVLDRPEPVDPKPNRGGARRPKR